MTDILHLLAAFGILPHGQGHGGWSTLWKNLEDCAELGVSFGLRPVVLFFVGTRRTGLL